MESLEPHGSTRVIHGKWQISGDNLWSSPLRFNSRKPTIDSDGMKKLSINSSMKPWYHKISARSDRQNDDRIGIECIKDCTYVNTYVNTCIYIYVYIYMYIYINVDM